MIGLLTAMLLVGGCLREGSLSVLILLLIGSHLCMVRCYWGQGSLPLRPSLAGAEGLVHGIARLFSCPGLDGPTGGWFSSLPADVEFIASP